MADEVGSAALSAGQKAIEVGAELIKLLAPLAEKLISTVYHKSVDGIGGIGEKIANIRSKGTVTNKGLFTIPDFDKLLATMRSMEISANIIIQNLAQLNKMYDKSWEIMTGNCDSLLFLGGQEASKLEAILMLNQAASDRDKLSHLLKIPENMMTFVTGAPAGSGLIYCGLNGSLPFKDDFPTDTKLYKLMTTKFGE